MLKKKAQKVQQVAGTQYCMAEAIDFSKFSWFGGSGGDPAATLH
jgi:hypothetical protein